MSDALRPRQESVTSRVLVVDDHAVVREGLKRMLEASDAGWEIVEAVNAPQALEWVRGGHLDVAVLDISMPGMCGLALLKRVRTLRPQLPVLMLSMHAEELYAVRAFRSGANGYVTKDSAPRELATAIRKVTSGGTYVSEGLAHHLVRGLAAPVPELPHERLSNREWDILRRLAAGDRPTQIAASLHISIKTVSTHKARILARLQLPNTAALIRYAVEHRLGPEESAPARAAV
ncbi:MAG TPA: response regulator transcription factor [Burkholderiaceae bacterium]